jgi:hypothetical protein
MTQDFETFEILGVPGHTGILFHWGNWNKDSDGCLCLGMVRSGNAVLRSREAFANFMHMLEGVNECTLVVT